jgi:thioredoxin 1
LTPSSRDTYCSASDGDATGEAAPAGQHRTEKMSIIQTTDTGFDKDVLKADRPVLVDFWAEWCGPCKMIAPFLQDIDGELGQQVQVVKVNIDDNPLTPTKYGVRGIPTLMIFKNGAVTATKVGALPKSKLVEWVQENV